MSPWQHRHMHFHSTVHVDIVLYDNVHVLKALPCQPYLKTVQTANVHTLALLHHACNDYNALLLIMLSREMVSFVIPFKGSLLMRFSPVSFGRRALFVTITTDTVQR